MSFKTNNSTSKRICECCSNLNCTLMPSTSVKRSRKPVKKVLSSKKLGLNLSKDVKSFSDVINNNKKQGIDSRKVTKSDMHFNFEKSVFDFCAKCGDAKDEKTRYPKPYNCHTLDDLCHDIETQISIDQERNNKKRNKSVEQFYKNEKFRPSTSNLNDIHTKKGSAVLDPIMEGTEGHVTTDNSWDTIVTIHPGSVEEIGYFDPEDKKSMEDLKSFRKTNYFECHSVKSRISTRGSVTSLNNHKCVYRFYLNDRLFPVSLHTDCHNSIRCVECNLPLKEVNTNPEGSINGTIQTKVKLDSEVQDMILMLPVQHPLIVEEKKRMSNEREHDILYFGVIKLSCHGDSIFNRTLPIDSLALRYQKGYKEFVQNERCQYQKVEENNVIVI